MRGCEYYHWTERNIKIWRKKNPLKPTGRVRKKKQQRFLNLNLISHFVCFWLCTWTPAIINALLSIMDPSMSLFEVFTPTVTSPVGLDLIWNTVRPYRRTGPVSFGEGGGGGAEVYCRKEPQSHSVNTLWLCENVPNPHSLWKFSKSTQWLCGFGTFHRVTVCSHCATVFSFRQLPQYFLQRFICPKIK